MPNFARPIPPVADPGMALVDGQQLQMIVNRLNQLDLTLSGVSEVEFTGAAVSATLAVTGQSTITASSLVFAWVSTTDPTDDHTSDEHAIERFYVFPSDVVPGVGFTLNLQTTLGVASGGWNVNWSYV